MSGFGGTAQSGLNMGLGVLQALYQILHPTPKPTTSGDLMGIKLPRRDTPFSQNARQASSNPASRAQVGSLDLNRPGTRAFADASRFGEYIPKGQPMDPDALQESLIDDMGREFLAATNEKNRALEWGGKFVGELGEIETEGKERLAEFGNIRRSITGSFRSAKQYTNSLFGYAQSLPGKIMLDVKKSQATAMALYENTRSMATEAMKKAGLEVATLLNGTREGIDQQTEDHKTQLAAQMSGAGYDNESIGLMMKSVDYEKGSVLLSQFGAIAEQQVQRLTDLFGSLTSVVGQAGSQTAGVVSDLTRTGVEGRIAGGNLMATAAEQSAKIGEIESTLQVNSIIAEASYASNLDALRAQGYHNAAGFFAAIQDPVLATSSVWMNMNAVYQSLAGEDNAAALSAWQAQMMPFETMRSSMNQGFAAQNQYNASKPPPSNSGAEWLGAGADVFGAVTGTGGLKGLFGK